MVGKVELMLSLVNNEFASTTKRLGFVNLPLDTVATLFTTWMKDLYFDVAITRKKGRLRDLLPLLKPLEHDPTRSLLVEMPGGWTAYFDNNPLGTDAESTIGVLTKIASVQGVTIALNSHPDASGEPRTTNVHLSLRGPDNDGHFLNYVRTVQAVFDDGRWRFFTIGQEQTFEEPDSYKARYVRDRFTPEMLQRYCLALGIDAFNEDAYGPEAYFITTAKYKPRPPMVGAIRVPD